jgi:hypothetical protein
MPALLAAMVKGMALEMMASFGPWEEANGGMEVQHDGEVG